MRTNFGPFLAIVSVLLSGAGQADEPHLDLIRGLRASGDAELALRYIETRLPKDLPEPTRRELTLELARIRVDLAQDEPERSKRRALLTQARREFEAFLSSSAANDPQKPQVRFELARLVAAQGREAVLRSRRLESAAKAQAVSEARSSYKSAAEQINAAAQELGQQVQALGEPKNAAEAARSRELTQNWYKAELEEGTVRFFHALTYPPEGLDVRTRATLMSEAIQVLNRLGDRDPKHPICWLAKAWVGRCYVEIEDYNKAEKSFDAIQAERGLYANDAKRVASYFRILMLRNQGTELARLATLLQSWLDRYRPYINTPEGCGARYFLADTLEKMAYDPQRGGVKVDERGRPKSVTAEAAARLKQAERLLRSLTEFDNEFTELAANKRMRLLLAIAIRETPDRDPRKVDTFEKCYLLALLEVAELNEDLKNPEFADDPERVAEARRQRYLKVAQALDRGLTLLKPADRAREIQDARLLHVYAHLIGGDPKVAAQQGEELAKQLSRSSRGAVPALYALQAHRKLMLAAKAEGDGKSGEVQEHRQQMNRLTTWMEQVWPNEEATDTARHLLGSTIIAEGEPLQALEIWDRVSAQYPNLFALRGEQGAAAAQLQRDPRVAPGVKQQWLTKVISLLQALPRPDSSLEADIQAAYCQAQLQLGNLLALKGDEFPRIEKLSRELLDSMSKMRLGSRASGLEEQAQILWLFALRGQIYAHIQAKRYEPAAELYRPVVDKYKKNPLGEEVSERLRRAVSDFLILALRSSIQHGQIEQAQDIWQVLAKIDGQDQYAPLVGVLRDLQVQISQWKRSDPQALQDSSEQFAHFLEALAKQANLSTEAKILLAQGYASLDKPKQGLELLRSIGEPPNSTIESPPMPPPENATDMERAAYEEARAKHEKAQQAHEAAIRLHHFAELTEVRLLRQAIRLATDPADKTKYVAEVEKLLDRMIGSPEKPGWAFNSLEVRREKIFLLEDLGKYRAAMDAWVAMQKPFARFSNPPKDDRETRIRTAYYEVRFYMTRLVLMSKKNIPDAARREAEIRKLATQIVEMEQDSRTADFGGAAVRKLYQDWLGDEPEMLKAYVAAGGKALLPAASTSDTP
jgi:tetratricopeptide (TPR) repeat protein